MQLRPLTGALGAEITGVNLAGEFDNATFSAIHDAFLDHHVLVFPDQSLTPERQIAFMRRFGAVEAHPMASRPGHEEFPELLVLENRPGHPGASNDFWHSDISCAEVPPMSSLLHALTIPEGGRGDTMFCNMVRAYETLSDGMRAMLDDMTAEHTGDAIRRRNAKQAGTDARQITEADVPVSTHPVVRRHLDSGKKALYVNEFFTSRFSGMTEDESRPLLDFLVDWATRPENVYRHRWRVGDAVMWDNRATMHYAVKDYDESMLRKMHRTTAAGDRPAA